MRAALQGHDDHVVRGADAAVVEHAGIGVGARAQHRVNRVDPAHRGVLALRALGPLLSKLSAREMTFPFFHQARRSDDVLGPRVVQRADFIIGPHLPQFLYFSAASWRSWRVSLRAGMEIPFFSCKEKARVATLSQPESRRIGR